LLLHVFGSGLTSIVEVGDSLALAQIAQNNIYYAKHLLLVISSVRVLLKRESFMGDYRAIDRLIGYDRHR
jgi:hypothetical protein